MQLSIVIPIYNESEVLPKLLSTIREVMGKSQLSYELLLIDDGSQDGSRELLTRAAAEDRRVRALLFSRNFGHQAAITAGIDHAQGDAVVVMDGDLQDPPELLPEMFDLLMRGYDVVSAQRASRDGETIFKRMSARWFYWLFRKLASERIQPEVGDFRMFSRRAIVAIRQLREQHRFMRGMVAWLGLKEVILPFHRNPRLAGNTKYSTLKMLRFAWTAILSFSSLPLRLNVIGGVLVSMFGFAYGAYSVYATYVLHATMPGWTSIVILNIIFSGTTLIGIGLLGEYVARIYEETKGRPLYVVSDSVNLEVKTPIARGVLLAPSNEGHEKTASRSG